MRNSNTLKALVFTGDISNNPEKLAIYARSTLNGKHTEISLKRYVWVNEWDENKGRLHGLTHKARYLEQDEEHKTLMEFIKYHYESQKSKLRPGTMKNYYGTEKYPKGFWSKPQDFRTST